MTTGSGASSHHTPADGRIAVRHGDRVWSEREFSSLITTAAQRTDAAAGITLIVDVDPVAAIALALAVRRSGGIPLIGDDRWDDVYRETVASSVATLTPHPDAAWATLSSGSTGAPRVIVRSDASWRDSFDAVSELIGMTADDTVLLPSPLVSSISVFSIAHARHVGATILLPVRHTIANRDLERATVLHGTPHALQTAVERIETGAAHRLRVALIGGAHLDTGLRRRAEALGIAVVAYYGAAELSFVAVDRSGAGLFAFPGAELRVADGVLHVRSPYFAFGYPGAVHGAFEHNAEAWGTVGDLVDGDGVTTPLQLRGRRDGAILTAAATVVPEDVEAALRDIDGINEAVVFGLPQPRIGALVAAVLEHPADRNALTLAHVVAEAKGRLVSSHLPRRWYVVERLPRTGAGKVARAEIRRAVLDGEVARLA